MDSDHWNHPDPLQWYVALALLAPFVWVGVAICDSILGILVLGIASGTVMRVGQSAISYCKSRLAS